MLYSTAELRRGSEERANLRGYCHWALTDNFEWHNGYSERFGLFFTDYERMARIPKDSAARYAWMAVSNGEKL